MPGPTSIADMVHFLPDTEGLNQVIWRSGALPQKPMLQLQFVHGDRHHEGVFKHPDRLLEQFCRRELLRTEGVWIHHYVLFVVPKPPSSVSFGLFAKLSPAISCYHVRRRPIVTVVLRLIVSSRHSPITAVMEGIEDPSGVLTEDYKSSTLLGGKVDAIIWQCRTWFAPGIPIAGIPPLTVNVVPEKTRETALKGLCPAPMMNPPPP